VRSGLNGVLGPRTPLSSIESGVRSAVLFCRWWLRVPWCVQERHCQYFNIIISTRCTTAHHGAPVCSQTTWLSNAPFTDN